MPIDSALLTRLAAFDTPTISNTIELFEIMPRNRGYMDGRVKAAFPELPPMVGFAATAAFRSDAPPAGPDAYVGLEQQIAKLAEVPGPAVIVFQDLDSPAIAATFGEVICSTYKAFGAAGIITSGAGRDLEQVRALNFPAFTGGTICSHGYCHIMHLGMPAHVGGMTVYQGELLHGDMNGVTRVPLEIADEIPGVAAEFVAAEKIVIEYAQSSGTKSVAEWSARRKEFSAVVAKLTQRVRRAAQQCKSC